MGLIRVWTKQNEAILTELERTGRHVAKEEFLMQSEDSQMMLRAYHWLTRTMPQTGRPADANYPTWLSLYADNTRLLNPGTVILELEVDESLVTKINVEKWDAVSNLSYIPADEADAARHDNLLRSYGISDAKACMTPFYPALKREIENSWIRLYHDQVQPGSKFAYGLIWEVKAEWIRAIRR